MWLSAFCSCRLLWLSASVTVCFNCDSGQLELPSAVTVGHLCLGPLTGQVWVGQRRGPDRPLAGRTPQSGRGVCPGPGAVERGEDQLRRHRYQTGGRRTPAGRRRHCQHWRTEAGRAGLAGAAAASQVRRHPNRPLQPAVQRLDLPCLAALSAEDQAGAVLGSVVSGQARQGRREAETHESMTAGTHSKMNERSDRLMQ